MKPIKDRKESRQQAKAEAVKGSVVAESLRNPGIEIPKPEAATSTPAQRATAEKQLLADIESGEVVVIKAKDLAKLKKRVDEAEAACDEFAKAAGQKTPAKAAKSPVPADTTPPPPWIPNTPPKE